MVLGVKRSCIMCPLLLVLVIALISILTALRLVSAQLLIIVPILVIASIAVGVIALFFSPLKPVQTRKVYFYLVALTCFVLAGGWFVAINL